jgi:hypothetical protein
LLIGEAIFASESRFLPDLREEIAARGGTETSARRGGAGNVGATLGDAGFLEADAGELLSSQTLEPIDKVERCARAELVGANLAWRFQDSAISEGGTAPRSKALRASHWAGVSKVSRNCTSPPASSATGRLSR